MNILSLAFEDIAQPTGGLGKWVKEVYSRLSDSGHKIVVFGFGFRQKDCGLYFIGKNSSRKITSLREQSQGPGEFLYVQVPSTIDFATSNPAFIHLVQNENIAKAVMTFCKKSSFDVIHIHDYHAYRAAALLRIVYKAPIVMHSHLSDLIWHAGLAKTEVDNFFLGQELAALSGVNKVAAVSECYKQGLSVFTSRDDIDVIHNGVDYQYLSKIDYEQPRNKTVCFCGRMTKQKGFSYLFKAAKELKGVDFNIISKIHPDSAKDSWLLRELNNIVKTCKNVDWFNNGISEERKYRIMKSASVAVMPSTHEPFGLVALEFMALGVPLITTAVDGLGEFCNENNSIVISPSETGVYTAIKNFKRSEPMVLSATKTAQSYDWDKTARKTEVLLNASCR